MNNEGLAKKAQRTHQEALELFHASSTGENKAYSGADSKNQLRFDASQLEEGDLFLGWKDTPVSTVIATTLQNTKLTNS